MVQFLTDLREVFPSLDAFSSDVRDGAVSRGHRNTNTVPASFAYMDGLDIEAWQLKDFLFLFNTQGLESAESASVESTTVERMSIVTQG